MLHTMKAGKAKLCGLFMLALGCIALTSVGFATDMLRDVSYPEGNWGSGYLKKLKDGPLILSRDEVFEMDVPPTNDSEETRRELTYLRELMETARTPEQVERIHYEHNSATESEMFINEGLLDPENYKTIEMITTINDDHLYFILERKMHFARARPNQLDKGLITVIDNPDHAAYPSGHAGQTHIVALMLSDFDPDNTEKYMQYAYDVGHRREIAGVHYPSDSVAGRKLAEQVLARLRQNPVFEKKYQDTKASYIKPKLGQE